MTEPSDQKKKRRGLRFALYVCAGVVVLAVLLTGLVAYSIGRSFQVADWVKDIAETRFSEALPEADVTFEGINVAIEQDWHPRILLERVVVTPADGGPVVEFSEVETSLSYRRLLQRQIAPREFRLSGVILQARREKTGEIGVAIGATEQSDQGNTELNQLVGQIDGWLTLPQFERLSLVDIDAVTIRFDDLRAGRGWTVDGGQMQMRRNGDQLTMSSNFALLGGRDYVSTLEMNYESQIGSLAAQLGVTVDDVASEDIASQSPALAWLDIVRAPISGAMRLTVDEDGLLGPLSASLEIQQGVFQPRDSLRPVPFESARSYFTYAPDTNTLTFDELSLVSAWGNARAEGKAHLEGLNGEAGLPNALLAQFKLTEFSGNPAGLFNAPVSLEKVQADFRLRLDPFEINLGEVLVQDQGESLLLNGDIIATDDDWDVALNAKMGAIDARRVMDWWPENAAAKTRKWVDENIYEGQLSDVNFAVRSRPQERPEIYLDFRFDEVELRYAKTLPLVEGGKGQAVLMNDRFAVLAHAGSVAPGQGGVLDIAGTQFIVPNTREKPTKAEVNIKTAGTVTAVLALLDHEPLSVISKANLPVDLADGLAKVDARLDLALVKKLKAKDVRYSATAELSNVRTSHFTPPREVSAPRLIVKVDNEDLRITGAGRIGSVPFDAAFETKLAAGNNGKAKLAGTVELSERFIDEFEIGLSQDVFSGRSKGQFTLNLEKNKVPQFVMKSNLVGTSLGLNAIGWRKTANQSAELEVAGRLSKPLQIDKLALNGSGLKATGSLSLKSNGALDVVSLSSVKIGNWLDGAVDLIGRGNATPGVRIRSGSLDLRKTPTSSTGGGSGRAADGTSIQVALNRVTISEGIALRNVTGDFSTVGGFSGQFAGAVNGGAKIEGSIVPQNGRSAVRIRSADAGGTLRSAGVLEQTRGGTMELTLRPVGEEGNYDGVLAARNMRVKDAPAMAELLNAISVIGLLEQLGGDGIAFAEVDAQFRLTPTQVILTQGSAVGPSMGLSMDGLYDLTNSQFDMRGVISPVYLLNVVGRPIARKGEGLFGFNYRLIGDAKSPKVKVNPLSVLTPGILRDIFRGPQTKPKDDSSGAANN